MKGVRSSWTSRRSILAVARLAAALNILGDVPAGYSVTILRKVFVPGNAAATAANVLGSEAQFRLGFAGDVFGLLLFVASISLLYEIFKPAGRRGAVLYLVFMAMGAASQALECIQDLAALALLKGGAVMSALPPAQAQALAFMFLRLHASNYQLALIFMGAASVLMGALILRSTFFPRWIGPLEMIEGLGFLTFGFASFLSPPLVARLYPYVPFGTAFAEPVFYLWLLIRGVNAERWLQQARSDASFLPAASPHQDVEAQSTIVPR